MNLPPIVSAADWQIARDELLAKEKAATKALDALAAERRRLPMVRITSDYDLQSPEGTVNLPGLFDGRRQLVVYHFMSPLGERVCSSCASFTDNVGHLAHLHARDTSFAMVTHAPLAEIQSVKTRMGWTVPWVSSFGTTFNEDFGVMAAGQDGFGLSVLLRDGGSVYRTYFTRGRGVDRLRFDFNLLDLTPLGRQEEWEDSPEGWPQTPPYTWWRLHDEYEGAQR
ncbi:MAG TPA: DUF899 domain-containing protein [Micromonosporaceae bacterium]|nr:DUF899 domain-containing protein [Micromonosporaceae bacterium]